MRQDHPMTPGVLDARQQHEPNHPGRRAEDGGYESADMADQGAKQFRAGQSGMYTAEDMCSQASQGYRDGYAAAKGEACPEGYVMVPVEPTPEHIDSIAMRYRHDFGLLPEDQRDNLRRFARQMYEECTGQGFYQIQPAPDVQEEQAVEPRKKDSVLFHLAEILRKAQGRTCDETGDEIDVGYECMRIRELCMAAPPAPPAPDVVGLMEVLRAADEYLSNNKLNQIGSGSILHRQMHKALGAHQRGGAE